MKYQTVLEVRQTGANQIEKFSKLVRGYSTADFNFIADYDPFINNLCQIIGDFQIEIVSLVEWRNEHGRIYNSKNSICVAVYLQIDGLTNILRKMVDFLTKIRYDREVSAELTRLHKIGLPERAKPNPLEGLSTFELLKETFSFIWRKRSKSPQISEEAKEEILKALIDNQTK